MKYIFVSNEHKSKKSYLSVSNQSRACYHIKPLASVFILLVPVLNTLDGTLLPKYKKSWRNSCLIMICVFVFAARLEKLETKAGQQLPNLNTTVLTNMETFLQKQGKAPVEFHPWVSELGLSIYEFGLAVTNRG